jgi:peptidoglycan/LPS O-acetylase OafA/YrhL
MNLNVSSPTEVIKPKIHFYFVDALRGIASLWVVLFHAPLEGRLDLLTSILPHWLVAVVFNWGSLGVAIFFVLSGFAIAHSLREARIDLAYFGRFSLRRFVRITPPYYVSIVITLGFALLSAYVKGEAFAPGRTPLSFERLFAHLFYLQDIFQLGHINDIYWTLCIEIQFYLVFCVLLGLAQWLNYALNLRFSRAVVFVPAAILAALFPIGVFPDNGRAAIFLPLWYGFLLGVFAYWSWRDKLKPMYFYFYAALLLTIGLLKSQGFIITCVITAVLLLEVGRANYMQVWLNWRWLQFLGQISYSLYLFHVPILGAIFFIGYKLFPRNAAIEVLCLCLGIFTCIGFATMMWQLIEKPSIGLGQKVKLVKNIDPIRG